MTTVTRPRQPWHTGRAARQSCSRSTNAKIQPSRSSGKSLSAVASSASCVGGRSTASEESLSGDDSYEIWLHADGAGLTSEMTTVLTEMSDCAGVTSGAGALQAAAIGVARSGGGR